MAIIKLLLFLSFSLFLTALVSPQSAFTSSRTLKLHHGYSFPNPMLNIKSQFLDHAARVLRRKGFSVVSTALTFKKLDLLKLTNITVFATPDRTLFSEPDGFHYNFLHHVVPKRYRLAHVKELKAVKTVKEKLITVGSTDGFSEIYYNRWIVVISVGRSFYATDKFPSESPSPVYEEEDTLRNYVGGSELLVSGKMVESAPSKQMNNIDPLDRISKGLTADISRRKLSLSQGSGGADVRKNSEIHSAVQFQVADDLYYYT